MSISGFLRRFFLLLHSLQKKKRCLSTQEFTHFLSTGVVIASPSRAMWIQTSLLIVIFKLRVLTCVVFFIKLFRNWIGVVQFGSHEVWFDKRVWFLVLFSLLFGTNYVFVITKYWSSNHLHHQWIGIQENKVENKCTTEWLTRRFFMKKMRRRQEFIFAKIAPRARLIKQNALQVRFFDWILMGCLFYWYRGPILGT